MSKIVFTNGCFDILHPGHIDLLNRAKGLGTKLIVGINSDESVRSIKGQGRPYFTQQDRAAILLGLEAVDEVHVFDESTPATLIEQIKPDILVKGGDWKVDEIIGADTVLAKGGEVLSLPLVEGFSTTKVIDQINQLDPKDGDRIKTNDVLIDSLEEHRITIENLLSDSVPSIRQCAEIILDTVKSGGKILICGNGGSAADAQHIAAEFVGRYETERQALPAIALTTDTSALTALANDYDFERIFSRQVEALGSKGDCLIAISTSGNSPNIISATMAARKAGCRVIGMTGAKGKKLASLSDACLMVPATRTARIQEAHITVAHIWCEMVDRMIADSN